MSTDGGHFLFYTVQRGHVPGVYRSWQECEQQVNGYRNSEHSGFRDLVEAMAWLRSAAAPPARQPTPPIQTGRRRPSSLLEGAFCSISSSQYRVVRDDLAGVLVGFLVTKILNLDSNGIQFAVGCIEDDP
ncbi:uncharacterized protein LOC130957373 [Arachis stenosperma]|uniref:uncharacterized protein LOC130957373 n=1 Tax=Arachis stenosperma TaxID=217475 RepID=UPI0025AC276C|nr:uncharacterized protein LOC130957373 [Arachis stenosperma]